MVVFGSLCSLKYWQFYQYIHFRAVHSSEIPKYIFKENCLICVSFLKQINLPKDPHLLLLRQMMSWKSLLPKSHLSSSQEVVYCFFHFMTTNFIKMWLICCQISFSPWDQENWNHQGPSLISSYFHLQRRLLKLYIREE